MVTCNDGLYLVGVRVCLTVECILHRQYACVQVQVEGVVGLTGEAEDELRIGGLVCGQM